MPKTGALQRSWSLFRASLHVLQTHRKLALFPLIAVGSFIAGLVPFVLIVRAVRTVPHGSPEAKFVMLSIPISLLLPFVGFLMTSLMSGAFYHECVRALVGEPVSVRRGFRAALRRIRAIVVWHLFSGLASYLTRLVGGQFGLGGKITEAVVGLGWGVASFFVVPILMREPKQLPDPIGLVRKSTALLRRTWGESITGLAGMSVLMLPLALVVGAIFILSLGKPVDLIRSGDATLRGIVLGLMGVGLLWAFVVGLAGSVYRSALYIYATEGVVPEPFDQAGMDAAWRVKKTPAV